MPPSTIVTLAMVRCSVIKSTHAEDWCHSSLFYTYTKCKGKVCRIVIDSGSSFNIISKTVMTKFGLETETHPRPYSISCVEQSNIPMTNRCLVPIQLSSYHRKIWCDIIAMDVLDILLGCPWLYDLDATHYGHRNTYEFTFNGKKVHLLPYLPHELRASYSKGKTVEHKKLITLLRAQPFLQEVQEIGVMYTLLVKEVKETSASETPPEVLELLDDYCEISHEELPSGLPRD